MARPSSRRRSRCGRSCSSPPPAPGGKHVPTSAAPATANSLRVPGLAARHRLGPRLPRPRAHVHAGRIERDLERLPPAARVPARERAGRRDDRAIPRAGAAAHLAGRKDVHARAATGPEVLGRNSRARTRFQGDHPAGLPSSTRRGSRSSRTSSAPTTTAGRRRGRSPGSRGDNATGRITIHLEAPQADFENVLASEFAALVPARAPASDTSLHPLPATGPYVIKSYKPNDKIVEARNPYFDAAALRRQRPGRESGLGRLGRRAGRRRRAEARDRAARTTGTGFHEIPPGTARGRAAEVRQPDQAVPVAEHLLLLHEHPGGAVHEPPGAPGRELRDRPEARW